MVCLANDLISEGILLNLFKLPDFNANSFIVLLNSSIDLELANNLSANSVLSILPAASSIFIFKIEIAKGSVSPANCFSSSPIDFAASTSFLFLSIADSIDLERSSKFVFELIIAPLKPTNAPIIEPAAVPTPGAIAVPIAAPVLKPVKVLLNPVDATRSVLVIS